MKTGLSRRQFLGAAGAIFGLSALGAAETFAYSFETNSLGRLGLMLPAPKLYPRLADEFTAGLAKALPVGQSLNSMQAKADLLDFAAANDTLIAYASPSAAALLRNRLAESPVQLVAADLGMDVQRFNEKLARLSYISLNYWQASHALALWTRENLGAKVALVADSYETGYDSFSVFHEALPEAELFLFDKHENLGELSKAGFDAVAFALHGERAQQFVRAYEGSGANATLVRLPYVGAAVNSARPVISAELAMDETPFYTLGLAVGMALRGQDKAGNEILVKRGSQVLARLSPNSLPYHGLSSAFKAGWTNPYLV